MTSRIRHSGAALAHSVSRTAWRDSFTLRPADAIFAPAIKVGIAAALVLVAGGLMGHEQLAGIAALGALTSAFGRYQPYKRLAPMLAIVAAIMVLAVGTGALLGAAGTPLPLQILALSALAAIASHLFAAFGITGPGAVIMVFAAAAGSGYSHSFGTVPRALTAMVLGAAVGWLVAMAPVLVFPLGPARLAAARAIASVFRLSMMNDGGTHLPAARQAVQGARVSVTLSMRRGPSRSARSLRLNRQARALLALLDEAQSVLDAGAPVSPEAAERLLSHESQLRRLRGIPVVAPPSAPPAPAVKPTGLWVSARDGLTSMNNAHQALRMAGASALSGWAAVALGLDHPLWASMGAVAALQGLNYSHTVQRGIQRLVGNVVGAIVAVGILSLSLGYWPSVALVVLFQILAELLVLKNYTLTTIAVTPMALIMTGLGTSLGPEAAVSRVADTLVGVVIGVLVAAFSISRADRHHLPAEQHAVPA